MIKRLLVVVTLLATVAGIAGCGVGATATSVPQPTAVAAPAATAVPTATQAAASTSAPASPTAAPEATAQPAATATSAATPAAEATFPVTITDDAGRKVEFAEAPRRIVSVAPSNTEILFALGLADKVVGVSDNDNYPPEVSAKERVGGFQPNVEKIVSLSPDLVLAIGGNDDLIAKLEAAKIPVVVLEPKTLQQIDKDIETVGALTGSSDAAKKLTAEMDQQVQDVVKVASTAAKKPKVYWELDATLFTVSGGSFVDSLISLAGGTNVFNDVSTPFPQVSLEQIVARDPEVIILADANYGETPDKVRARQGWADITAIKNNAVYPINDDLVSRPGPRVVLGLQEIAKILHPDLFK